MFAKVHPAEDVKSGNTGSCHDLVRYLEKETGEGQRFFLPYGAGYFTRTGNYGYRREQKGVRG